MTQIKVIGFDLDDTLWDNTPVMINAEKTLAEWLLQQVPDFRYDLMGMRDLRMEVVEQDPGLKARLTEMRWQIIHLAMDRSGYPESRCREVADAAMAVFLEARNDITFFEGTLSALTQLAEKYILGSLSNGNSSIFRLGLEAYFSFAFSAEDVGAAKPDPALFQRALEHTEVAPAEMIYVGDDPVLDIDAANHAGLRTIWLNRKNKSAGETAADVIISDIAEVVEAVEELAS